jgi:hypothetical protein
MAQARGDTELLTEIDQRIEEVKSDLFGLRARRGLGLRERSPNAQRALTERSVTRPVLSSPDKEKHKDGAAGSHPPPDGGVAAAPKYEPEHPLSWWSEPGTEAWTAYQGTDEEDWPVYTCHICLGIWPTELVTSKPLRSAKGGDEDGDLWACPNCLLKTEGETVTCVAYTKPKKEGESSHDCRNEVKDRNLFCRYHLRFPSRGPAFEGIRRSITWTNSKAGER